MNKKHKWHDEICAWAAGQEIEFSHNGVDWEFVKVPYWNEKGVTFRIKPQPKPDVYLYVYQTPDLRRGVSMYTEEYKGLVYTQESYIGKIKLEQDDE